MRDSIGIPVTIPHDRFWRERQTAGNLVAEIAHPCPSATQLSVGDPAVHRRARAGAEILARAGLRTTPVPGLCDQPRRPLRGRVPRPMALASVERLAAYSGATIG